MIEIVYENAGQEGMNYKDLLSKGIAHQKNVGGKKRRRCKGTKQHPHLK